ncbi:MAG: hypothetical protein M1840_007354 [Geoglossum simile]|nr:MAG: hypothetical protein M1840_007354 [Geoglossum simile]
MASMLTGADFLVLSQPERDFWRPAKDELRRWVGPQWAWDKLAWSAALMANPRGLGWSWEVKNVPRNLQVGCPARKYMARQFLRFLMFFALLNAVQTCIILLDPVETFGHERPLGRQVLVSWLFWIGAYSSVSMGYSLAAAVFLLVGMYDPSDFAPAFGRIRDAWTTWHQSLRRPLSTFGLRAARALGLRKGTNASSYTQLYVAFLASAVIHVSGAIGASRRDMGELKFFLGQAAAITFEDLVMATAKMLGWRNGGRTARAVGYLWVFCWFSYSLRWWASGLASGGVWSHWPTSGVGKALGLLGVKP